MVKTQNGVRLWVNEPKEPLIDSWVTPGPEIREVRKTIFLLGGRCYRISLAMLKFKDKSASVELMWKPPFGTLETVPSAVLMPQEINTNVIVNVIHNISTVLYICSTAGAGAAFGTAGHSFKYIR